MTLEIRRGDHFEPDVGRIEMRYAGYLETDRTCSSARLLPNNQIRSFAMRIEQKADQVTVTMIGNGLDGIRVYEGHYVSGLIVDGMSRDSQATPGNPRWSSEQLVLQDPDHVHFSKAPPNFVVWRVTAHANDVPCDPENTSHTGPVYAFMRARSAINERKDYRTAVCWFHVAANQGHVRSMSMLAILLYGGLFGVDPDYPEAFAWAQRAATQGDMFGQVVLSAMYREGKSVPADRQKAAYWAAQARGQWAAQAQSQRPAQGMSQNPSLASLFDQRTPSGFTAGDILGAAFSVFFSNTAQEQDERERIKAEGDRLDRQRREEQWRQEYENK